MHPMMYFCEFTFTLSEQILVIMDILLLLLVHYNKGYCIYNISEEPAASIFRERLKTSIYSEQPTSHSSCFTLRKKNPTKKPQ
jgi:hypothetical protein